MSKNNIKYEEYERLLEKESLKWDKERIKRKQCVLSEGYLKFHMPDEYYKIALKYLKLGRKLK